MDFLFWRAKELKVQNFTPEIHPWILWYIWKARNDKVFTGSEVPPHKTLQIACSEAAAWEKAKDRDPDLDPTDQNPPLQRLPERARERFPPLTCQIDASWKASDPSVGLGWVFLHPEGRRYFGLKGSPKTLSALHAEIEGLLWAMESLLRLNFKDVKMKTDCSVLTKMIEDPPDWPAFYGELDRFEMLRMKFTSFSLTFISRKENGVSDHLAKLARKKVSWFSHVSSTFPNRVHCNGLEIV